MSNGGNDFLARLLATFQLEAQEHLQVMSSGLLEVEKASQGADPSGAIESIFREAHSLKGAARAVGMSEIETICQSLESVFSTLKRDKARPSSDVCDVLHHAIDAMGKLLDASGQQPNQTDWTRELVEQLSRMEAIAHGGSMSESSLAEAVTVAESQPLQEVLRRAAPQEAEPYAAPQPAPRTGVEPTSTGPAETAPAKPHSTAPKALAPSRPAPTAALHHDKAALAETVRISTAKLDSLLLQAEEMVGVKLTSNQRASDLRLVEGILAEWKKGWAKALPELRALRQSLEDGEAGRGPGSPHGQQAKLSEFIDWNETQMRVLESRIATLARSADHDQRSFGGMVDNLLEDMKKVLMLPFSSLLAIFPKLVRDISRDQGKNVDLVMRGAAIEIDRRILEEMKDPLIHLVRNSIDHGLEKPEARQRADKPGHGSITIAISQVNGNNVEILVADDGSGIDVERVKQAALKRHMITEEEAAEMSDRDAMLLIFQSEVSTSPIITDLSGRGLGLAIVREKAEKLGGTASVDSVPGGGTTFRLVLPLTLATFRGILVEAAGRQYVVPTANVERVTRIRRDEIKSVESTATISLNGRAISLVSLADVLGLSRPQKPENDSEYLSVLVLGAGDRRIAFGVDAVINEQEVLVKGLGKHLVRVRNVAGATVLGSGRVAPILSVPDLVKSAARSGARAARAAAPAAERLEKKRHSILVAEDSITSRMLLKNILESAQYDVKTAVDGMDALTTLKNERFDLVVSDVEMPRMNGFDLIATIRADKELTAIPVVLVTSLESREDRERGIDVGANAYIVKSSFDQSNLLDVIRKLV